MADVTTYKRATAQYVAAGGIFVAYGEVRAATDPVVTANPSYWVAFTDAELASARIRIR